MVSNNLLKKFTVWAGIAGISGVCALAQVAATPNVPTTQAAQTKSHAEEELSRVKAKFEHFAQLERYQAANKELPAPAAHEKRVIFFGDSITDNWGRRAGVFFPGKPYVNRGIGGQTTEQMILRFRPDVIALNPKAVVILAGTNDLAGNTGPTTPERIEENFETMTELAQAHGIRVVLASILPAAAYPWRPGILPVENIRKLNAWMKDYCSTKKCVYLDYYSALATPEGAMKLGTSSDGVHPTTAGYEIMAPLAEKAIAEALK